MFLTIIKVTELCTFNAKFTYFSLPRQTKYVSDSKIKITEQLTPDLENYLFAQSFVAKGIP